MENRSSRISIIGLDYARLPLTAEFVKLFPTLSFDVSTDCIAELEQGADRSQELAVDQLKVVNQLKFTAFPEKLSVTDTFITVSTPINSAHQPDLTGLQKASEYASKVLKPVDKNTHLPK